jgi:hypothetical protein
MTKKFLSVELLVSHLANILTVFAGKL